MRLNQNEEDLFNEIDKIQFDIDMNNNNEIMVLEKNKLLNAINAFEYSVNKIAPYDKEKNYSLDEISPYEVLTLRLYRAVELSIIYFNQYVLLKYNDTDLNLRELLPRILKDGLISNVELWMDMRTIGRLAFDDENDFLADNFNLITGVYFSELINLKKKILE